MSGTNLFFFLTFRIYFSALKDHKSTLLLDLLPWRLSISISDQIYSGLFRLNFILQLDQPQSSIYHIELHSNSHLICKYKIEPQLLLSRGQFTIYCLLFELLMLHFSLLKSDSNICFVKKIPHLPFDLILAAN